MKIPSCVIRVQSYVYSTLIIRDCKCKYKSLLLYNDYRYLTDWRNQAMQLPCSTQVCWVLSYSAAKLTTYCLKTWKNYLPLTQNKYLFPHHLQAFKTFKSQYFATEQNKAHTHTFLQGFTGKQYLPDPWKPSLQLQEVWRWNQSRKRKQ